MNQFGFHAGLRFGVPGIVLSYLMYALWRDLGLPRVGLGEVAAFGVFVGLMVTPVFDLRTDRYFKRLAAEPRGVTAIVGAIKAKLSDAVTARVTDGQLLNAMRAYYASRYNDAELYAFREPKTYGVMYYNLYLTFVLGLLISAGIVAHRAYVSVGPSPWGHLRDMWLGLALFAACAVCAVIAHRESTRRFLRSLEQETFFWQGKPRSFVSELAFYPEVPVNSPATCDARARELVALGCKALSVMPPRGVRPGGARTAEAGESPAPLA